MTFGTRALPESTLPHAMLSALLLAVSDLAAPPLRRVVALSLAITVASFIAVWLAAALGLSRITLFGWQTLNDLMEILGTLAVLLLSWLLFPAVATLVMGFFLDRVAAAVEQLHYPNRGPARLASITETIVTTLRLMAITIILNLLALPVYVLVPGVNFFVFLGLNGYLFGREYFEVVAARRLEPTAARALRKRFAGRVFGGGVVIAGLFAVPIVNLAAPVIATAFMVHLLQRLQPGRLMSPA
ncbi:MAG: EI24 domain-containing protein [Thiohalocapsa sp.]